MITRRVFLAVLLAVLAAAANRLEAAGWKAGVATTIVTPQKPMWMAGYGGRSKPAEGKETELWVKAVALEDAQGHRGVIVSTDTLGIPRSIWEYVTRACKQKYQLEPAQVMLNASHTHCGPVLRQALYDIYPLDQTQIDRVLEYSAWLEKTIVETIGQALDGLEPARVYAGAGTATFAVNRRNNLEPDVPALREAGQLKGPVDHSVPVLVVRDAKGQGLRAVVFGYACHNTTLSFYKWCGDYAGFAQMELEKRHPGAAALFFEGCGADQNPLPRRTVELAQGYGKRLADAVDLVLNGRTTPLKPILETSQELIELDFGPTPTREELGAMAKGSNYRARWAKRLLGEMDAGKTFQRTYSYPVQVWRLGKQQWWITLGGEVVVDYSLAFKKLYGEKTWVTGYCNDVMAYIPSLRVLDEDVPPRKSGRWGYEGNTSMMVYGLPCHRWAPSIEERITAGVERQVKALRGDQ